MNNNEFVKVKVEDPWYVWRTEGGAETGNKFNRPNVKRRYIKILALCLSYASAKVIYQGVKNPVMHQVRDMCRAGLLDRYTRAGDKAYYYKTTARGYDLLAKALGVR